MMLNEDFEGALPILEDAYGALAGAGTTAEAYTAYNLAFTRFALGSCQDVLALLDRSESIQGERTEISRLRQRAEKSCEGSSGNGKAKGKGKGNKGGANASASHDVAEARDRQRAEDDDDPEHQSTAPQTSLPAGVPMKSARTASTMVVNGLFSAKGCSQEGIDSTGTNADDTNVSGNRIVKPIALAVSGEDDTRPISANTQEKAYPMKSSSAIPARISGASVWKRKPTASPTASMTTSWITFSPTSASRAAREHGGARHRQRAEAVHQALLHVVGEPSAVTKPPNTMDCTRIPGSRKST